MTSRCEVLLDDGRSTVVHDTGAGGRALVWHHGSPQTGALLRPVVAAAAARGLRVVSCARPGYGGSTRRPGRDVASVAGDVARVADALGLGEFAVMGASGGGPHALACAALLPGRVTGAVCLAGVAPWAGDEGWFAGMAAPGGLRAATAGPEARARHQETAEFDPASFTAADWAALAGAWAGLGEDAQRAGAQGSEGLVDDDVAFVRPWGFALGDVEVPVLVVQGGEDRVVPPHHADLLLAGCGAELWLRPRDGHVSVLAAVPVALDWLLALG